MNATPLRHLLATYGRHPGIWFGFVAETIRSLVGRVLTVFLLATMVAAVSVGDFEKAKQTALYWAIITIAANIIAAIGELVAMRAENAVYGQRMLAYYKKLTGKDMKYFRDTHAGYLSAMVRQYIDSGLLLTRLLRGDILRTFISLTFPVVVLLLAYWPIGLVALFIVITQGIYVFWASAQTNKWRRISDEIYRRISGVIADDVTNIVAFKSAGKEKQAYERLAKLRDEEEMAFWKRRFTNVMLDFPRNLTVTILALLGFWLALSNSGSEEQTVTVLVMTTTYMFQILRNIADLPHVMYVYDDHVTKMEPTLAVLSEENETIRDTEAPAVFEPKHGAIEIKDLVFEYNDANSASKVFDGLSLSIAGGERVGIVGISGAGKSTLASLLMRFDDIQSGQILIDGIDIKNISQSDLRAKIAYVPQEPLLFHRSIKQNIAYHNNKATQRDIEAAAKAAHAHEFISKLPEKYETIVGERGVKLSGGQKQRVVIARAILKKAPIILFDEATSALDSESEHIIQKALPGIIGKHTAIIIAHRLSTVADLDRIIVMHDGKIIEEGTHAQLLAHRGRYYSLWQKQISEANT